MQLSRDGKVWKGLFEFNKKARGALEPSNNSEVEV